MIEENASMIVATLGPGHHHELGRVRRTDHPVCIIVTFIAPTRQRM